MVRGGKDGTGSARSVSSAERVGVVYTGIEDGKDRVATGEERIEIRREKEYQKSPKKGGRNPALFYVSGFHFSGRKWHFIRPHRHLRAFHLLFVWRQNSCVPPFASFESKGFQWLRNAMGQQTLIYGYLVATVVQMFGLGESRESILE